MCTDACEKLQRLLYFCMQHRGNRPARFVFLGDYIDRGPDSCGVISTLLRLQRERSSQVICLRGNHEALMLHALPWGRDEGLLWVSQGGAKMPGDHLSWVQSLPLSFDDGLRMFVHAGVNPAVPLDQQSERDLLCIREPFLSHTGEFGRLIVHGHTPTRQVELRPNRVNLDTGAVFGARAGPWRPGFPVEGIRRFPDLRGRQSGSDRTRLLHHGERTSEPLTRN